jgi:hypothetical protein
MSVPFTVGQDLHDGSLFNGQHIDLLFRMMKSSLESLAHRCSCPKALNPDTLTHPDARTKAPGRWGPR